MKVCLFHCLRVRQSLFSFTVANLYISWFLVQIKNKHCGQILKARNMFWSQFIYESLKGIGFKKICCTLQHIFIYSETIHKIVFY